MIDSLKVTPLGSADVVFSLCGAPVAILNDFSVELMMESQVACACNTDRGISPEVDLSGVGIEVLMPE
jgi:hypothetical protein